MKYLNASSSLNTHEEFLRATAEQKGVWFDLFSYCHQQMNSGMIVNCMDWPDTIWQRIAGSTAAFIMADSPLWHFSSSAVLVIHHYNAVAEDTYKRKQAIGRRCAIAQWEAKKRKNVIQIPSSNHGKPQKDNHA